MNIRAILLLFALPALSVTPTASAQVIPSDDEQNLARHALNPYLAVVSTYRTGDADAAVADIRKWSREDILRAQANIAIARRRLTLPPAPAPLLDVTQVEAAVVLHTHAAFAALTDGEDDNSHFQLNAARNLLAFLVKAIEASLGTPRTLVSRRDVIGHRDWHLATVAILQGYMRIDEADRLAQIALKLFPNDAGLHLAAGSVKEQLADDHFRELALLFRHGATQTNTYMHQRVQAQERRNAARGHYERALALDPGLLEAHLRLGHLLFTDNRLQAARPHLEAALRADGPRLRFLAHLFIGAIEERERRLGDAILSYRRAMELDPDAQSARVALAHALEKSGVPDEAREVLEPPLKAVGPRGFEEDGFWMYPRGQYLAGAAMLALFRERVKAAPSP